MNAKSVITMVEKFIEKYGVEIEWPEPVTELNSRGVPVTRPGDAMLKERVLLLKERYNPISSTEAPIGASLDTARYIFCLPGVKLGRDDIVTDSHGNRWRLDEPDWFDVNGEPVCKQAPVIRVEGVKPSGNLKPELIGGVSILGILKEGETLTADISELQGLKETDPVIFQWYRSEQDGTISPNVITDAQGKTYILTSEDVGMFISVTVAVSGFDRVVNSDAFGPVEAA